MPGPLGECGGFRLGVDHRPLEFAGEHTVLAAKTVRAAVVEAQPVSDRVDELMESARHHADPSASRMYPGDEFRHTGGDTNALGDRIENRHREPCQSRYARPQARLEVELTVHCANSDVGYRGQ